ncbi:MAG: c-type cytochrome [Planctomycetes bacterium]|nr:c-type cytochrome [Planctomycetota bacterium]
MGAESAMPAGIASLLPSRQQFLDLARYLLEIAEQGPARERELRPDPALFAPPPLPEYEREIDHAGLIAGLDGRNFQRGEAIYNRVCANCHGTRDRPGTLPTSLAFAAGKFKNGSDPYSMYRTLTRGFGMMVPQTWMSPRQKYEVIHYIREAYLKNFNPTQYAPVDAAYLSRLPEGKSFGPEPAAAEPWSAMDYGPALLATYEIGEGGDNFAYKGIAVRLDAGPGGVSQGRFWMLYDHDTLRAAAGWSGRGFIDWNGINFNGRHEVHPRLAGRIHFTNPMGPGWADPATGSFEDARRRGRDGQPYGPLPRAWGRYRGIYHYGDRVIVSYTVGEAEVLELPGLLSGPPEPVFVRFFNIGPRRRELVLQAAQGAGEGEPALKVRSLEGETPRLVAVHGPGKDGGFLVAGAAKAPPGAAWLATPAGRLRLRLPAGSAPVKFALWIARAERSDRVEPLIAAASLERPGLDLAPFTRGGPPKWPSLLATQAGIGGETGPFAVDALVHPENNPWLCQMRFTGFDFLAGGGRAAACSWDGDVWLVEGIDRPEKGLVWRRLASGLFQPLGLKVESGQIYVSCRDQIAILRDLNGDGEADFYENFNNDHQVTEHFHEFAMDLQADGEGNFYYAKGARHARTAIVPQHGTLLRVSRDGARTDILATGFRAPNGVCLNSDGTFFLTDQEGHWTPKNRIDWVVPGRFYGNLWGYHDVTDPSDGAMEPPVCWITNRFDRSPSELVWVASPAWGPLNGSLLNFSYGYGKVYTVLRETVNGRMQGGMCQLPVPPFPTGVMRGRFHPESGHLYTCGMYAWSSHQTQPGGFYRVRRTVKPLWAPVALKARRGGLEIAFSGRLDPKSAGEARNWAVAVWSLRRGPDYGSEHIDEHPLKVAAARTSPDGSTVFLEIPGLAPTPCMEIRYFLKGPAGETVEGEIHNTIHGLAD